jgi:DNA-binding PadR family transcriptional regulator
MAVLPMTMATRRVLQVFLDRPMERLYGSRVSRLAGVSSGATYPVLARLEGLGWLSSFWEYVDPRAGGRPARRCYGLTYWGESQARGMLTRDAHAKGRSTGGSVGGPA